RGAQFAHDRFQRVEVGALSVNGAFDIGLGARPELSLDHILVHSLHRSAPGVDRATLLQSQLARDEIVHEALRQRGGHQVLDRIGRPWRERSTPSSGAKACVTINWAVTLTVS